MPTQISPKVGMGCLILFCAPFCLFGLFALGAAVHSAYSTPVNWTNVLVPGIFGLSFTLAGAGIAGAAFKGWKKLGATQRQAALYPQAPWMWREDWAHGRVQNSTRASMVAAWVFAIVWNLISWFVLRAVAQAWEKNRAALLGLIFPAVGLYLLFKALRQTIRWKEFGKTWFDLATLPGVVGKELRGTINVHFPWPPQGGVHLKLSCVNRVVSGSGKDQQTSEKILWRDEHEVPAEQLPSGPIGSAIPVVFRIPIDALETSSQDPRNSILWCLEADARTPGVNYQDIFEVPVFRTKDTPADTATVAAPFASVTDVVPAEKPLDSRIVVRPAETGGTEFDFSAARNPGSAIPATAFFLAWTAIVWFTIVQRAPLLFPIVFGLFDVALFIAVLFLWLGSSKVVIGSGSVMVRRGLLGIGRRREIPFSAIAGFTMPVGMQSGGRSGTPYYDIKLRLVAGQDVTLASGIRNKLEAEWLIAKMKSEAGAK